MVEDIEVTHNQERENYVRKEEFERDRVDPSVCRVNRVGIVKPEGMKLRAMNRVLSGDV